VSTWKQSLFKYLHPRMYNFHFICNLVILRADLRTLRFAITWARGESQLRAPTHLSVAILDYAGNPHHYALTCCITMNLYIKEDNSCKAVLRTAALRTL